MQQMRRQDRQLSQEQAWQVLRQSDHGFLAMTDGQGAPYCVPLAYAVVGATLYFHSGRKGQKLDCIRQNPRVCFSCVLHHQNQPAQYTMQYASCVAVGNARLVADEAERQAAIRAIFEKYSPQHLDCPAYDRMMRAMPAIELVAVEVDELCGKANPVPKAGGQS